MKNTLLSLGGIRKMESLIGKYQNGNYFVSLYSDGTKIRVLPNDDEDFVPEFAENCDVHISSKCNNNCDFCYANCSPNGKHGELLNQKFLDTLHPYTEMAINLNFPSHPDLIPFLEILKEKQVVANLTVNQKHFIEHQEYIRGLYLEGLFTALGVSLVDPTQELLDLMSQYENIVLHVINGIVAEEQLEFLKHKDVKVLILGYKDIGKGTDFLLDHVQDILINQKYLYENLSEVISGFEVVAFDNLALYQLDVKRLVPKEKWEEFYMGDDGSVTFYIDLVSNTYSKNSLSETKYNMLENIDVMFSNIRSSHDLE